VKPANIETFRAAGAITRYHTVRTLRHQSIAEHSWAVTMLVLMVHPTASPELLKAALVHDVAEIVTGDIPATAKWKHPQIKNILDDIEAQFNARYDIDLVLDPFETQVLKWCDMMELVLWCQEEMELGNRYATPIHTNGVVFLEKLGHPTDRAEELFNAKTSHWRQHGERK